MQAQTKVRKIPVLIRSNVALCWHQKDESLIRGWSGFLFVRSGVSARTYNWAKILFWSLVRWRLNLQSWIADPPFCWSFSEPWTHHALLRGNSRQVLRSGPGQGGSLFPLHATLDVKDSADNVYAGTTLTTGIFVNYMIGLLSLNLYYFFYGRAIGRLSETWIYLKDKLYLEETSVWR